MIFIMKPDGTIMPSIPSPVYQGADGTNVIYLFAPSMVGNMATVAFRTPDGVWTEREPMTQVANLPEEFAKYQYCVWQYAIGAPIARLDGVVAVQFFFYANGAILPSSASSFVVGKGVPVILPPEPPQDVYDQILQAISAIQKSQEYGDYAARAIFEWRKERVDGAAISYGIGEFTYVPAGAEGGPNGKTGSFIKSLVAENTHPPYVDGKLNSEYWAEVVNFDYLNEQYFSALQNLAKEAEGYKDAAETAQSRALSAKEAAEAAQKGALTAKEEAQTAEENARESAQAAATSEGNASISESNAAEYEKNAADARDRAIEAKDAAELAAGQAAGDVLEQLRELKAEAMLAAQNAQSAQEGAETAQSETLTAKEAAQAAQQNAETAKEGAELAQRETLAAKEAAETAQEQTLTLKNEAQEAQTQAETSKEQAGEYAAQTARDAANAIASAQTATEAAARAEEFAKYGIRINTDYSSIESLPRPGNTQLIYFIPNGSSAPNAFDEYVWTESGEYEKIGTTEVDLSAYLTKESAAETYATKTELLDEARRAQGAEQTNAEAIEAVRDMANAAIPKSEMGKANGVASLGADGIVPSTQLPTIPTIPDITISTEGSGNVISNITVRGHNITVTKTTITGNPLDSWPINSIYVADTWVNSIDDVNPAKQIGGTWTMISSGYALWTWNGEVSTNNHERKIQPGLPNIVGETGGARGDASEQTGPFSAGTQKKAMSVSSLNSSYTTLKFDASQNGTDLIYGKSDTVQPPAYKVFAWRRTA